MRRRPFRTLLLLCAVWRALTTPSGATQPNPGYVAETLLTSIDAATTFEFAPDGGLYIAQQTGRIHRVENAALSATPVLDISDRVDDYWERGLIGMEFHPAFPRTPYLYVLAVLKEPHPHHVVLRYHVTNGQADPASERLLFEGDDQSQYKGPVLAGHQGGPLVYGPDDCLYFALGEHTSGAPSQSLDALLGKILRIRADGSIPQDNPFFSQTQGKYQAIYARGLRNPYGLTFQPSTGRLYASDVGGSAFEEINEIRPGENYGWPQAEGVANDPRWTDPILAYPPAIGGSICGGVFYPESVPNAPEILGGRLLVADWKANWLKAIDVDQPNTGTTIATQLDKPVWVEVGPEGAIYVLNRGTIWRDGNRYQANNGSLVRLRWVGEDATPTQDPGAIFPKTLAETGLFHSGPDEERAPSLIPYELNHSIILPGFESQWALRLPEGQKLRLDRATNIRVPEGTVVTQQLFRETTGALWETRIYTLRDETTATITTYRPGPEGSTLVETTESAAIPGTPNASWMRLGPQVDTPLDQLIDGFTFPLVTRQWNRDIVDSETGASVNQLVHWRRQGWLESPFSDALLEKLPQLTAIDDEVAGPNNRIASFLDTHCASCHRPGGLARGSFDARWRPGVEFPMLHSQSATATPVPHPDSLTSAADTTSVAMAIWSRMATEDFHKMPPTRTHPWGEDVMELVRLVNLNSVSMGGHMPAHALGELSDSQVSERSIQYSGRDAIFRLEPSGGGLSSIVAPAIVAPALVDRRATGFGKDPVDWLSFSPTPGTGSAGEYRGFPNAVHQQAGNYFHPKNQATDLATTTVIGEVGAALRVSVDSETGHWAGHYDFEPDRVTFTMTSMPEENRYWILYEGTPGGELDAHDWRWVSGESEPQSIHTRFEGDLPDPEWIAFGDPTSPWCLVLYAHQDDPDPDHYYPMNDEMTVFGFGRAGLKKYLDTVPRSFTIGLVPGTTLRDIEAFVENAQPDAPVETDAEDTLGTFE